MLDNPSKRVLKHDLSIHKSLFYEPASLSLDPDYAAYPGQFKVNRVLQSKSNIFHIPGTEPRKEKKTIVISDCSIFSAAPNECQECARELIEGLISADFDVRVWNGKEAIKISEMSKIEEHLGAVKAAKEEDINTKLAQENKASDAIFHLDYFGMRELLLDDTVWPEKLRFSLSPNTLYVSDFKEFKTFPQEIYQWLKSKKFRIKRNYSYYEESVEPVIEDSLRLLTRLFSENITGVELRGIKNFSLFELIPAMINLEELEWQDAYFRENEREELKRQWDEIEKSIIKITLPKLKKLTLRNSLMPSSVLAYLLDGSDNFHEIIIDRCIHFSDVKLDLEKKHKNFKKLEHLAVDDLTYNRDVMASLIATASSLKTVDFRGAFINKEDDLFLATALNDVDFHQLKEVNFVYLGSVDKFLTQIIKKAPNLEKLSINYCIGLENFSLTENKEEIQFAKLKSLTIFGDKSDKDLIDISCDEIGKIISAATALEKLELHSIKYAEQFTPEFIADDINFLQLKKFQLCPSDKLKEYCFDKKRKLEIPLATYLKILAISPNLTTIELSYVTNLDSKFHQDTLNQIDKFNLDHINNINLTESTVTSEIFKRLLCQASNVNTINLSNCANLADLMPSDIPDDISFPNLNYLNVAYSSIRGDTLAKIIAKSSNLKNCDARNCKSIYNFDLSRYAADLKLEKLESFLLQEPNLSLKEYLFLLRKVNIITLNLEHVNLDSDYADDTLDLSHVKKISVPDHPNVGKILGSILPMTPNVRTIESVGKAGDLYSIYSNEKTVTSIVIKATDLPENLKLPHLQTLYLRKLGITGAAALKLIKAADAILNLDFESCKHCSDLTCDMLADITQFEELSEFKYKGSNLPVATIIKIATFSKERHHSYHYDSHIDEKRIDIRSAWPDYNYNQKFTLPPNLLFKSIKQVNLENNNIDDTFFNRLICATPNVEKLSISCSFKQQETVVKNLPDQLPCLSELSIYKGEIPQATTEHLVIVSPKLRHLEIGDISYLYADSRSAINNYTNIPDSASFDALENIIVRKPNQYISNNFLYSVILRSKNLKTISLDNAKFTDIKFSHEIDSAYPQIEKIMFSKSEIPDELYVQLLRQGVKIKTLKVSDCTSIPFDNNFNYRNNFAQLYELEEINISNSELNRNLLGNVILNATELKILVLKDNKKQASAFKEIIASGGSLSKLTELVLENQKLDIDFIKNIHILFPALEKLTFKNCSGLILDRLVLDKNSTLYNLTSIVISECDINEAGFKKLILGSGNLKAVSIDKCNNIKNLDFNIKEQAMMPQTLNGCWIRDVEKITTNTLACLAKNNTKLTELALCRSRIDPSKKTLPNALKFQDCVKINLDGVTIDHQELIALMSNPKLVTINLGSLKLTQIPKAFNYSSLTFPSLTQFNCDGASLPLHLILAIYKDSPIKNIYFSGCTINYNTKNVSFDIKFPVESTIVANYTTFDLASFLKILSAATETKSISCSDVTIDYDLKADLVLDKLSTVKLNQLEKFSFKAQEKLNFPGNLFVFILMSAPKLSTVEFEDIKLTNLTVDDIPDDLLLPNIENVTLLYSELPDDVLQKLNRCMPNCKTFKTKVEPIKRRWDWHNLSDSKGDLGLSHSGYNTGQTRFGHDGSNYGGSGYNNKSDATNFNDDSGNNIPALNPHKPDSTKHLNDEKKLNSSKSRSDLPEKNIQNKATDSRPSKNAPGMQQNTAKESNETFEVDTRRKRKGKQKLQAKEVFTPSVHPAHYRTNVYPTLDTTGKTVKLTAYKHKELTKVNIEYSKVPLDDIFRNHLRKNPDNFRLYEDEIVITAQWQPLESVSPTEEMLNFYADTKVPYEVQYSKAENLYYIRAKDGKIANGIDASKPVIVNYILSLNEEAGNFPQAIQELINYCTSFPSTPNETLDISADATTAEVLQARYEQKVGSCIDRSVVFHDKFAELQASTKIDNNYKVRIIGNKIHAFVEIKDKTWHKVDLGGYEADLKIEKTSTKNFDVPDEIDVENVVNELEQPDSKAIKNSSSSVKANKKIITEADLPPEFVTWKTNDKDLPKTAEELFKKITVPGRNSLIKLDNPNDCLNVLATFSDKLKTPYLFIDSPDDLQWRAPGIKLNLKAQVHTLSIHNHFSKLRHFLNTYPEGILFINWSNFSATDITALHSIIDEERTLESENLPAQLPIVGFYSDNTRNAYKGVDFTSRLHEKYPWKYEDVADLFHNRCHLVTSTNDKKLIVDLFNSEDWETLLFGAINIQQKQITLEYNKFLNNLECQTTPLTSLHLKNPPWHLREFNLFWQNALQQGFFTLYGKEFKLDSKFELTHSSGYEFNTEVVQLLTKEEPYAYPLNSHTFHELFNHYNFKENGFVKVPGLFQLHKILELVVTEEIPLAKWSHLLHEAKESQVILSLKIASHIELPAELSKMPHIKVEEKLNLLDNDKDMSDLEQKPYAIIATNENSEVVDTLLNKYPDALYISLDSTHDFGDLFYRINASLNETEIVAHFLESDPWRALQDGKVVIIEGKLPLPLINALSPLFISGKSELIINGEAVPFTGKLLIATDSYIPFAKNRYFYSKSQQNDHSNSEEVNNQGSLEDKRREINIPSEEKNSRLQQEIVYDHMDLSLAAYEHYKEQRFQKIQKGFEKSPIIFYTGATGVGKTTYLLEQFENDYFIRTKRKAKLYIGENKIEAFAAHNDPCVDAFLFIDEANLIDQKLSNLSSIKSKKPHLLHNGHYYPIQKYQHIMLAGNANAYGGVRQQKEFFDKYAQTVECERPNHAYQYHEILKPQLKKNFIEPLTAAQENNCEEIAQLLLTVFDKINDLAGMPEPLLSQRHLHMMAVLFNAYYKQFAGHNVTKNHLAIAAALAIIGNSLTPHKRQALLHHLNLKYGYDEHYLASFQSDYINKRVLDLDKESNFPFSFTPSRYPVLQLLDAYLSMRGQDNFHFGLLLEGNSGTGKSTLVKNYLKLLDVKYIQLSLGKNYETDCKALLDAYYSDKVIIIDELNAGGPRYERLINTLIMKSDKEIKKIAKSHMTAQEYQEKVKNKVGKSKSLIIGTQNQLTMPGRQPLPISLQARFTPLIVPEYPQNELVDILLRLGVNADDANTWVKAYMLSIAYANFHHLEPKPNLRNLLRAAGVTEATKEKGQSKEETNKVTNVKTIFAREFSQLGNVNLDEDVTDLFLDNTRADAEFIKSLYKAEKEKSIETPTLTPINPNCRIDEALVAELKTHANKIHTQFAEGRHAIFAERRRQKYTAISTITRLYTQQQLTEKYIDSLEQKFDKLYDGIFSSNTKKLFDKVRTNVKVDRVTDLMKLENEYESIRDNPAIAQLSRPSFFHRNTQYSVDQLARIKNLKKEFIIILQSMTLTERSSDKIKSIMKKSTDKGKPKLIDFHLSTKSWLACGNTKSRTTVNKF